MEKNLDESRLEGKGRAVPRLGPVRASLWCSREWQGLRIRVAGCPEKVDSQQRPLPQIGPKREDPLPFMRSGQ